MKPKTTRTFYIEWKNSWSKKPHRGIQPFRTLLSAKRFLSNNSLFDDASPRIIEVVAVEKVHKV